MAKDLAKATFVFGGAIGAPFRPGEDIWAGAVGVKGVEQIVTIFGVDLATNEAIAMLLGVEILQRTHEVERPPAVETKLGYEGAVPHEEVISGRRRQVVGHKAALGLRPAKIRPGYLPGPPIHLDPFRPLWQKGHGKS